MQNKKKLELLAPAGDLEKLKIAVLYGADAVYIGGEAYGLRAKAKNFDIDTMAEGVKFAHDHGVKVYVTANIFAHNPDFEGMADYFKAVEAIGVDALIISDLGVFSVAKEAVPNMEIHVSTQANNTNYKSAQMWYKLGAQRVVVARELSMKEIRQIRDSIPEDMEIEAFVHGAMCISYSGRCLISQYMTGRDANHGACAQPCRWNYSLMEEKRPGEFFPVEEDSRGTYLYNSKDMCMIEHIPQLIECGISSLKIEGRAKSAYYVACVTNAYRHGIDAVMNGEPLPQWVVDETEKISHRAYSTGFYSGHEPGQTVNSGGYIRGWDVAAVCTGEGNGMMRLSQRNRFFRGETVSVLEPGEVPYDLTLSEIYNEDMEPIESAPHATMTVYLKTDRKIKEGAFLRVKRG